MSNNRQHDLLMPRGDKRKNRKLTKKHASNHPRYPHISKTAMTIAARTSRALDVERVSPMILWAPTVMKTRKPSSRCRRGSLRMRAPMCFP
eukprot:7279092-Pyramimonas_sp.AAC.1